MSSTDVRDDQLPRNAGSGGDVKIVPAASVLLLRGAPIEVLMIRRVETASFVPSAWVFPGGVVDPIDGELAAGAKDRERATMQLAAARELFEETGVWLGAGLEDAEPRRRRLLAGSLTLRQIVEESPVDLDTLVWTSRWVTPAGIPKRFDTWFFIAEAPQGCDPTAHAEEATDLVWIRPEEALARHADGGFSMVFPTIKNLETIASYRSIDALLEARRRATIPTTQPVLVVEGGKKRIVLPE
jgi:recombination protein RecT